MAAMQKVIIPKGLVNPRDTTIVEIPKNLQNVGTVVARPTTTPRIPEAAMRRAYGRHTYPSKKKPEVAEIEPGKSYGGREYEDPYDESIPRHSWIPQKRMRERGDRHGEISPGDVSYGYRKKFDPELWDASTPQGLDYVEGSLYRDFRPRGKSSRHVSPARTPKSVRKYRDPDATPESLYSESGRTSSPEGISEEDMEESSYYEDEDSDKCPCPEDESSGGYRRFDSDSSGGAYQKFDSPEFAPSKPPRPARITQREVMNSLGELETVELGQIMGDLSNFQNARRRLVYDASSLSSAADVSNSLLTGCLPKLPKFKKLMPKCCRKKK